MNNKLFTYSDEQMRSDLAAVNRVNPQEIRRARQAVIDLHEKQKQGWLDILDNAEYQKIIQKQVNIFKKFKNCLVLGIGGSDLGARAILDAIRSQSKATKIWFAGDTTDPEEIEAILDEVPWKSTCINVISKSGGTLETMSVFFTAKERLEKAVGKEKAKKSIICTTDPEEGYLLEFAKKMGYATLPLPKNIGGRFSVLTAVGIFPLALAGIDVRLLLQGGVVMREDWLQSNSAHMADRFAAWQYSHDKYKKRNIHTMFAYAACLQSFIYWWRQIWAESLGKAIKRDGRANDLAPTPIASIGPTDQHSQLQLYQEGPDDKIYTFILVDKYRSKLKVSKNAVKFEPLSQASGRLFSDLINFEAHGTIEALNAANRPTAIIKVPTIDEFHLGGMIVFFELATAMAGEFYNIDAFNQPGVEESKKRAKRLLTGFNA